MLTRRAFVGMRRLRQHEPLHAPLKVQHPIVVSSSSAALHSVGIYSGATTRGSTLRAAASQEEQCGIAIKKHMFL